MKSFKLVMMCLLLISSFVVVFGATAQAQDTSQSKEYTVQGQASDSSMLVDIFVARPLGFIGTATGTAVFVVSLPFSALGRNVDSAFDEMVVQPARYTFLRPLGVFIAQPKPLL